VQVIGNWLYHFNSGFRPDPTMKPRYLVLVLIISVVSTPFVRGDEPESEAEPEPEPEHEPGHESEADNDPHPEDDHHEDPHPEDGHHDQQGGTKDGTTHDDGSHNGGTKDNGHTDGDHPATTSSGEKPKNDQTPEKHDENKGKDGKEKGGEHSNGKDAEHKETAKSKEAGGKVDKGGKKTDDDSEDDDNNGGKVTYGGYSDVSGMPDSPDTIAKKEEELEKDDIVKKAKAESENGGQPGNYEEDLSGLWTTIYAYSAKYSVDQLTCWTTDFSQANHKALESQSFKDGTHSSWPFTMQALSNSKTLETNNMASPSRKLSKIYVLFFKEGVIGYYSCSLLESDDKDKRENTKKDKTKKKSNCQAGISVKEATEEIIDSKKALLDEAKKTIKDHLEIDVVGIKTEACAFNKPKQSKPASESDGKSTKGDTNDKTAKGDTEDHSTKGDTGTHGTDNHDTPAPEKEGDNSDDDPPAPSTSSINKPASEGGDGNGDGDGDGGGDDDD